MGAIKCFSGYKLIAGILFSEGYRKENITGALEKEIDEIDYVSPVLDFNYTDYYSLEMGGAIKRFFVSFRKLVSPEKLSDIKILSNDIEKRFSAAGVHGATGPGDNLRRKVNIDPGILNGSRLILASTKDNAHRVPLDKGIYGEVTLLFSKGSWQPLPWTYIDYCSPEYWKILSDIRNRYKSETGKKTSH